MKYIISGKVIKGDGYGRKIGYPTINLDRRSFLKMKQKPAFGVYAGGLVLGKRYYKAGVVIGPLDKRGLPKIEAHLMGYTGNACGESVVLEINKFIRKFKKFKTEQELIAQIGRDLSKVAIITKI
jgi:riboflavin kinase / FMN adenylyltransferase